jgi:hypothetical protein
LHVYAAGREEIANLRCCEKLLRTWRRSGHKRHGRQFGGERDIFWRTCVRDRQVRDIAQPDDCSRGRRALAEHNLGPNSDSRERRY